MLVTINFHIFCSQVLKICNSTEYYVKMTTYANTFSELIGFKCLELFTMTIWAWNEIFNKGGEWKPHFIMTYTQSWIPVLQFKLNPTRPAKNMFLSVLMLLAAHPYFGSEVLPPCLMEKSIYIWTSVLRKYMPLCISCRVYRLNIPVEQHWGWKE